LLTSVLFPLHPLGAFFVCSLVDWLLHSSVALYTLYSPSRSFTYRPVYTNQSHAARGVSRSVHSIPLDHRILQPLDFGEYLQSCETTPSQRTPPLRSLYRPFRRNTKTYTTMSGVRDPAFWKRFSTAVHLDEESSVGGVSPRPELKQQYVPISATYPPCQLVLIEGVMQRFMARPPTKEKDSPHMHMLVFLVRSDRIRSHCCYCHYLLHQARVF